MSDGIWQYMFNSPEVDGELLDFRDAPSTDYTLVNDED